MSLLVDESKEQAKAYRYNAKIQERNEKALEQEADWYRVVSGIQKQDFLDDAEQFNAYVGAVNRNSGWASGGTAARVQMASIDEQEQQIVNMTTTAIAQERGIREQAINARMDAELNQIYARQAMAAGRARAFGTVASLGFKAYGMMRG